jgi:hypothetical protein
MLGRLHQKQPSPYRVASRRFFLIFGAAALSSCTQLPVSSLDFPNWRSVKRSGGAILSGPIVERVRRVGQTILVPPSDGRPWEFGVIVRDIELAATFEGNGIVISTAMVDACETDGELAAQVFWAANFRRLNERPNYTTDFSTNDNSMTSADAVTLRALAKAGYDPRDVMTLALRQLSAGTGGVVQNDSRLNNIKLELNKLGYQV